VRSLGADRVVDYREVPLADIADAHRYGETGRVRGKIVVRVAPDPV
jgi:NADPH:quinone reductase-like Zn-dependent oxidoreductase